ncbi:MAG: hypothetical protein QGH33_12775, partial [Pirellulaceae bacterium]|nr:hypothetical protein [Pirellulaceae bacterium]
DLLTGLLVISLGPAYGLEFRHRQEQAIRPAALAVAAYKLDNDGYPESLSDLVHAYLGSDPVDLFDRKPIRYKFSTKFKSTGFVVYSVGPDLDDDGGRSWDSLDENSGDDQADIPIRVGDYPDPNPGG